ncbi:hypothetical protein EJ066_19680 [Mesorhizobium sp. M9A.F.Ca.ET.002.03.1.2]|nr:hypothetical protein EJ066_19680 [Mesorhizobium sp. M9A.F.Ca.ET.002.03.1.2]
MDFIDQCPLMAPEAAHRCHSQRGELKVSDEPNWYSVPVPRVGFHCWEDAAATAIFERLPGKSHDRAYVRRA